MYQIGIDIGGTNVKIGLLDEALELTAETSVPFPHTTAADLAKKIRAAVLALLEEKNAALCDVGSLGAVVPGSIDASGETVLDAHNLDFHNVPLRKLLQEQFPGIPVYIANDANGAALAELYKGAFTGCKTGVLLTLGTGLGGGIILNGKMFNGGMNHGVELGHAYLVDGGEPLFARHGSCGIAIADAQLAFDFCHARRHCQAEDIGARAAERVRDARHIVAHGFGNEHTVGDHTFDVTYR